MLHDFSGSQNNANEDVIRSHSPAYSNKFLTSENVGNGREETSSIAPINNNKNNKNNNDNDNNNNIFPQTAIASTLQKKEKEVSKPSELRQNLFMLFITLTQLVQMIPLGAGINSGLAIGEALGATNIQSFGSLPHTL